MKRKWFALLCLAIGIFCSNGCMGLYRNYRIIEKGNIQAYGWRHYLSPFRYNYISIGTPDHPLDKQSVLFIVQLSNGEKIRSSDISYDLITAISTNIWIYPEERGGWPKGTKSIITSGYEFLFSETGRLLALSARASGREEAATIGTPYGSYFNLPLTEQQIKSIFGTNFIVKACEFRL